MPVERDSSSVVTHCGAWVSVARGFLNIAKRDAGVERGSDECMAKGVWSDSFGDAGAAGDAAHDPRCSVTVVARTTRAEEESAFAAFAHREIDRSCGAGCERDRHDRALLIGHSGRVVDLPETRFATTRGGDRVAFQVIGDGPLDVLVSGRTGVPIDLMWE